MAGLPLKPFRFDTLVFAAINELIYNVVYLEAHAVGLIAQYNTLGAEKVAHKASFFEKQIVFKARFTERMSAESSDTFLDELEANRAHKVLESILSDS